MDRVRLVIMVGMCVLASVSSCTGRYLYGENMDIDTTEALFVFYPHYNAVRFVCSDRPDTDDENILFCCTAAFSRDYSIKIRNEKICGAHVVDGKFHEGYHSRLINGGFIYDSGKYRFVHDLLRQRMKELDRRSGAYGFCQMRLDTAVVSIPSDSIWFEGMGIRAYRNMEGRARVSMTKFHYRALCEKDGKLCIVEARNKVSLIQFRKSLGDYGVSHALYLDTGVGWSYSWYRDNEGKPHELHPYVHPFNTNWIIFTK